MGEIGRKVNEIWKRVERTIQLIYINEDTIISRMQLIWINE